MTQSLVGEGRVRGKFQVLLREACAGLDFQIGNLDRNFFTASGEPVGRDF